MGEEKAQGTREKGLGTLEERSVGLEECGVGKGVGAPHSSLAKQLQAPSQGVSLKGGTGLSWGAANKGLGGRRAWEDEEEVLDCPSKGMPLPTRKRKLLNECLLITSNLDPRATANSTMVPRWLQLRSASWQWAGHQNGSMRAQD